MRCIDGTELTVEFTVLAQPFVRLNGGPNFKANEAISFMVLGSRRPCDESFAH